MLFRSLDGSLPTDPSQPAATTERNHGDHETTESSRSAADETQRQGAAESKRREDDPVGKQKKSASGEKTDSETEHGLETDKASRASKAKAESDAADKRIGEEKAQETIKGDAEKAKEAEGRKLIEDPGKSLSRLEGDPGSVENPGAEDAKASIGAGGGFTSESTPGEAARQKASLVGSAETKNDSTGTQDSPVKGAGDRGSTQEISKERGASLLSRESPREAPESDGAKNLRLREDGQTEGGGKESGKGGSRATVILRGNARNGDGGAQNGGGNQNSGHQDGFRFPADAGSRDALGADTTRGDAFRLDAGGLDASGRTANPGTSSLEGGRDIAPRHLHQQLKDFATGDVVRHARFVLKENAGGEIRLLLKPEQLGTVRVRLEVQDNRIAGRIIVENTTVRDAFEQTLSELQRAFREAGLETGSLEVTVGEDGQAAGQETMTKGRKTQAIEELEASVPTIVGELEEHRMINVYA